MPTEDLYGLSKEVEERATRECFDIAVEVANRMLDSQGRAPGDREMTDAEVVYRYGQLHQRGALTTLRVLSPKLAERMRREHDEAYARLTGFAEGV